jgi:hypothetical protein
MDLAFTTVEQAFREQIRQWVEEKRVFLQQVKYDAWSIWAEEGDE